MPEPMEEPMSPPRLWNPDNESPTPDGRTTRLLVIAVGLLFLSALPDAMVVPVLKQLMIDRYGVNVAQAHAFMAVNLVGAILVAGVVGRMKRRWSAVQLIVGAAVINGILLGIMAMPIGFIPTLMVRCLEGASDLLVYALLFDVIARLGLPETRGRRMGASATFMMLGIAGGIGIGGIIGQEEATMTLWAGMGLCIMAGFGCLLGLRNLPGSIIPDQNTRSSMNKDITEPLWPSMVMMFSDRAVAGLLASTVPLYFATAAGFSTAKMGMVIGISMLMTALGAWPMGRLAEWIGVYRLRTTAGIFYVLALSLVVAFSSLTTVILMIDLVVFGVAGAALFASSLLFVCNSGRGAAGMGAYHAAGNAGFLCGPLAAGALLMVFGGDTPGAGHYQAVLVGFGVAHGVGTGIILAAHKRRLRLTLETVTG